MKTEKLLDALQTEADLCRNEGANDIATLLDEAVVEIQRLKQFERKMEALASMKPLSISEFPYE